MLRDRIQGMRTNAKLLVRTFGDLGGEYNENDPNNESGTIQAIRQADIVVPVITARFFEYVIPQIVEEFEAAMAARNRYFIPVLLKAADWSGCEWLVKTPLTTSDAVPLLDHSTREQEAIVSELIKIIGNAVADLSRASNEAATIDLDDIVFSETVFISHDHDDADFAELLKLRLEKEGIACWIDSERLKVGQNWREEIDKAIEQSRAVVAVMTPEARRSEYVTYEWAFAWGKGKQIFPIMLKQTQLHPRLESLQYLNFTNHPTRPWSELVSSIKAV